MAVIDTVFPEKMTQQQLFDAAASWLLRQNRKSENQNGCLYRGPDGTACAVGCLIRDDEYVPRMDGGLNDGVLSTAAVHEDLLGTSVVDPMVRSLLPERLLEHIDFLANLQQVHDCYDPKFWPETLEMLANRYDLSTAVLESA